MPGPAPVPPAECAAGTMTEVPASFDAAVTGCPHSPQNRAPAGNAVPQ
jgi:hypothetical protein